MRILIDCTQVTRHKAGVGVYAFNTLREMIPLDPSVQYFLVVQSDDPSLAFDKYPNATVLVVPSRLFRKLPLRFLLEQIYLPWLTHRYRIDVLHSLHYSLPLLPLKAKKVVTVHDMTFFLMPEVHLASKVRYFQFFIRQAAKRGDQLIFDSFSSKEDFQKMFARPDSVCHVAHMGRSLLFHPGLDPGKVDAVLAKYNITRPFLLYIGTIEPRKNLARLIEAFATVASGYPNHTLVLAGGRGWMCDDLPELVDSLGLQDRVLFTGFIDETDKPYLIRGAEIFVYPSLYEGFGIPLLESMACGIPTLSSNVSSLPEVVGDAALLVNPLSTLEIGVGLRSLMADRPLRQDLSEHGIAQAAKFNWSKTAADTLEVYRLANNPDVVRSIENNDISSASMCRGA